MKTGRHLIRDLNGKAMLEVGAVIGSEAVEMPAREA
jgi:hypothetical protein